MTYIWALIVNLDNNGFPKAFAIAFIPVGLGLQMPASATGSTDAIDDRRVATPIDGAVRVLKGEGVDSSCTDTLHTGGSWPTGNSRAAVIVPSERRLDDR